MVKSVLVNAGKKQKLNILCCIIIVRNNKLVNKKEYTFGRFLFSFYGWLESNRPALLKRSRIHFIYIKSIMEDRWICKRKAFSCIFFSCFSLAIQKLTHFTCQNWHVSAICTYPGLHMITAAMWLNAEACYLAFYTVSQEDRISTLLATTALVK